MLYCKIQILVFPLWFETSMVWAGAIKERGNTWSVTHIIQPSNLVWDTDVSFWHFAILDLPCAHLRTTFHYLACKYHFNINNYYQNDFLTLACILMWNALVLIVRKKIHAFLPIVRTVIEICKRFTLDITS